MTALPDSRTMTAHRDGEVVYYSFPAFDALPFVRHGISTRLGGVSRGKYASMDLSFTRGDEPDAVRENFRRIAAAIGVRDTDIVISAQTHTTNVYRAAAADRGRGIDRPRGYTDIDGLLTDEPDVVLCTQYADCVPLLFADPVRRVVAASHAGWRGTAAGIGGVTVRRMRDEFGCRPADILAGIGPSVGACCFEVDAPVWEAFCRAPHFSPAEHGREDGGGKFHIDLKAVNARDLMDAGVLPEHITVSDLCTRCRPDVFWSHRACGSERGSLAAFIALI